MSILITDYSPRYPTRVAAEAESDQFVAHLRYTARRYGYRVDLVRREAL